MKKVLIILISFLMALTVFADEPFRNHRYDSFNTLSIDENSIVFIGNSITDMHNWSEAFGNDPRIVNRGNSGAVSSEVLANIETCLTGQPAKIFMMIGTNDIGSLYPLATPIANIRATMDRIRKDSPRTEVYLEAVLPSANGYRTTALERQLNDSIKKIAREYEATYIDLFTPLEAYMGDSYTTASAYTMDNLHLGAAGYEIWLRTIKPYLPEDIQITYPANTASKSNNGGLTVAYGMRATMFSMYPIEADDILFFGDEMVKCGEWSELMGNPHMKNRGTNWGYEGTFANMTRMPGLIDACFANNGVSKVAPKRILLYTAVGEINGTTAIADVKTSYQDLITKLHGYCPGVRISVVSLLPNTGYTASRVTTFNSWLKNTLAAGDDLVDYLDIYNAVGGKINTTDFPAGNNYLGGMGYYHVAKKIAESLDDVAFNMMPEDEVQALYNRLMSRNALVAALGSVNALPYGDGVGEYSEEVKAALDAVIARAEELLGDKTATIEDFQAAAAEIASAIAAQKANFNQPQASTAGKEIWYDLSTPLREGRYLTSQGIGQSVVGDFAHKTATAHWKFVQRTDGDWDIVNRADGGYIVPQTAQNAAMVTSSASPSKGWELGYSNTAGYVILHSGSVQMNQTNSPQNYQLYNWSSGYTGDDRNDTGCQFKVAPAPDLEEAAVSDIDISVDLTTGKTENKQGNATSAWRYRWVSDSENPHLTVTESAGRNNITNSGDYIQYWTGASPFSSTYLIETTTEGLHIAGYELTFRNVDTGYAMTVTPAKGGAAVTASGSNTATVTVSELETSSTSFTLTSSANKGMQVESFIVHLVKDKDADITYVEADPVTDVREGVLGDIMPRPKKVVAQSGVYAGSVENPTVKMVTAEELATWDAPLEGFDNEGYRLEITTKGITISAVSEVGVIRAKQTLDELAVRAPGAIPCCEIVDWPAFKVRGFMHDVGRSFIEFETLKRHLVNLARFKVNVFHWHMTDHYGFRFESKTYPQLHTKGMTRFEGKYYTQEQCKELDALAKSLGINIIPEIDIPGHSTAFTNAMGYTMASANGKTALKTILKELSDCFPNAPYIHIGCDETSDATVAFINEMSKYVKETLGRRVMVWNRLGNGALVNPATYPYIDMCQNWASSGTKVSGIPNIDCRYNYVNHFDVFADIVGIYKSTIFGEQRGTQDVAGAITALWNDRYVETEEQIIAQNNLYANALVTNERAWMGGGYAYIEDGGTTLPNEGEVYESFADWERRFLIYKDEWLSEEPIPYVKQCNVRWNLTAQKSNGGNVSKTFSIETQKDLTAASGDQTVTGAGVYLVHTWSTVVPGLLGKGNASNWYNQTRYAWTYVYSPCEQEVGAQIEFQNYGRSERDQAPAAGTWDWKGSKVWVNDIEILPPTWDNTGLSINWSTWDDFQKPLKNENFPARNPIAVQLHQGWNKVLLKLPYVSVSQVRLNKWMWTFVFTDLEGKHAVDGLIYSPAKEGAPDVDAILNASLEVPSDSTYSLDGRRISQPRHGIFISNGKKRFK